MFGFQTIRFNRTPSVVCILLTTLLFYSAQGNCEELHEEDLETKKLFEEKSISFLNELSARRRVTTFFPNFQAPQHGVQEKFVNTSKGNLTFLIRDLVVLDSMPIVMGRVYDSTIQEDSDFGHGWKLTVREEILIDGNKLVLVDASNSEYELTQQQESIVPSKPTLTPIKDGLMEWNSNLEKHRIVLRSADLVRQFELIGDRYRLVEISNDSGSIFFEYSEGLIDSVVAGNSKVFISRGPSKQIESITDTHGRSVQYTYDDNGSLSEVIDRSGNMWYFRYAQQVPGLLSSVVDPRGETILEASYSDEEKATWIRVMDQEASFDYRVSSTLVLDKLNRKTIYEQESNGITSGIVNPMGDVTRVTFDDEWHPVELARNRTKVASISYDNRGRIQRVTTEYGSTGYGNGKHGIVTAYGKSPARYEYDSTGRLLKADDKFGNREYEYFKDGRIVLFTRPSRPLKLQINEIGLVSGIIQGSRSAVELTYDSLGRVTSMSSPNFPDVTYSYDERGLRKLIKYGQMVRTNLIYDEVGNLTSYTLSDSSGTKSSDIYTLDVHNRVNKISSQVGTENSELVFNYDGLGRLWTAYVGNRSLKVRYDLLDRAELVLLDGEPVVDRSYRHSEPDLISSQDTHKTSVATIGNASAIFGSVNSIMYTRPNPTSYGPIGYSTELKSFVLFEDSFVPDVVFVASVQSRQIPLDGSIIGGGPFQFDKPSNALFLPGEFLSVNCQVCSALLLHVRLDVTQIPTEVNTPVRLNVSPIGWCQSESSQQSDDGEWNLQYTQQDWLYEIDWADGHTTSRSSHDYSETFEHEYSQAGIWKAKIRVSCSCKTPFAVREVIQHVTVPGPCERELPDVHKVAQLVSTMFAANPWEEAISILCIGKSFQLKYRTNSNPAASDNPESVDPCASNIRAGEPIIAGVHSHPVFNTADEMNAGAGCLGEQDYDQDDVETFNNNAGTFSAADESFVSNANIPLYLIYGTDRDVRVLNVDMSVEDISTE
ncbi:MAG: DUF6531 domain-containing protein [Gammaproteobacteria bacterium]|nr:DUF6531 domain-containing protein [Gammaproteobacteria bacterium]